MSLARKAFDAFGQAATMRNQKDIKGCSCGCIVS